MKLLNTFIPLALFGSVIAIPSAAGVLIAKRTANFNDLFAQVEAHISAAGKPATVPYLGPISYKRQNLTKA
jgi:hypothetical protein